MFRRHYLARRAAGEDGRLLPLALDVYSVIFSYYETLFDRGRVRFAPGEKWPGVLFCAATFPSHLVAFPFLATCWNSLLKRVGLVRIGAFLAAVEADGPRLAAPEPDLSFEPES